MNIPLPIVILNSISTSRNVGKRFLSPRPSSTPDATSTPVCAKPCKPWDTIASLMTRRILSALLCLAWVTHGFAQTNTPVSAKAQAIHQSAIVVDTHADTPQRFLYENYDIGSSDPNDPGHISLDKARAGNLGAEFFSIWVEPSFKGQFAHRALDLIDSVYEQAERHPDRMMMAFSVADIQRAHKQKKLAALMGMEGGHPIENDLRLLREFYRLGVRY